ncbi:MAG TPA: heme-copper oxidase subunit III [Mycobacteriales bacterium]|nr:heme-copper oxidase subunit III [Mycobacteriales bacterium]
MPIVATAAALETSPAHGGLARPNMVSVGTIVWLSSELMFFAALFAMYFTVRAVSEPNWPAAGVVLDLKTAAPFTVILILSSVTCQLGVFAAERGDVIRLRFWFIYTFLMGAVFVGGQAYEYFVHNSFSLASHAYGSVYYLTTGFHGMHVLGGLIAFLFVLLRTTYGRFTPEKATSAIVVSYYWHFVDIVWIGLFATIYLIR